MVLVNTSKSVFLSTIIDLYFPWTDDAHSDGENLDEVNFDERTPIQKFVADFNANYAPTTPLVVLTDVETDQNEDILFQLENDGNEFNIYEIIFTDYILADNIDDSISNLVFLFHSIAGEFSIDNIKSIIIPEFSVSLDNINIVLELPKSIIKSLIEISLGVSEVDECEVGSSPELIKASIDFPLGSLYF